MNKNILVLCIGILATVSCAPSGDQSHLTHLGTAEQQSLAAKWNRTHSSVGSIQTSLFDTITGAADYQDVPKASWSVLSPFSETEKTGFVALSGRDDFDLPALRDAVVAHLPADVTLVLYVDDASMIADLKTKYEPTLGRRLQFLVVPAGTDEIWGRDALPYPVHMKTNHGGDDYGLVNSLYPQDFSPDAAFATALSLPMTDTQIYFRGGNLLLDDKDNCFAENAQEVSQMDDAKGFFKTFFGCSTVTLLPQADDGIGDIDERIKFLGHGVVLTDDDSYADTLKNMNYEVKRIPSVGVSGETYMNTLLVNGTMFVPQMGVDRDQSALDAYRALGFNAIGVNTKRLADLGNGNIHCVSMNYPPGAFHSNAE